MARTPWMSSFYQKKKDLKQFVRIIDDKNFHILLNPEIGSWAVFTEDEILRYNNDRLTEVEMEMLYLRGLAESDKGEMVELEFPKPADYPNVVVVNITTVCNLRCKYCFADCSPEKGEYMSEDVMKRIISQMFDMPSPLIIFELQGGEPLCYIDGIRRFIEISEDLRKKTDKRVHYRTVTNCTLIDGDFIEVAKQYDLKVCISVDGPKELTDPVRIKEDGTGAFDDIMIGIRKLRENDIIIEGAVCTIGQHNYKFTKEIVNFFAENDISFKPRPANPLGRELLSKTTTKPGEWAEAYKNMYYQSKETKIENFSIHIFEENVYGPVRDYICLRYPCGAAREVISVNPNGDVFPCDGFKGENSFIIGNILKENLVNILNKEEVCKLKNRTSKDIKKCSICLYRAMCCSCCYSALGAFDTIYREDPHCADRRKIFEFLIDEWIRTNILKKE